METSLDCRPCLVRQSLEMARTVTEDTGVQEQVLRAVLMLVAEHAGVSLGTHVIKGY